MIPIFAVWGKLAHSIFKGVRSDPEFRSLAVLALIIVTSGTVFYRFVEGWSTLNSIYFTVATLTTVGYGDYSPTTTAGKIFTIAFILTGVGVIFAFLSRLVLFSVKGVEQEIK